MRRHRAEHGTAQPGPFRQCVGGPAWRVAFTVAGIDYVAGVAYGRKADAERGAEWLDKRIPAEAMQTAKQYCEAFRSIAGTPQDTLNLMVAETCQW